MVTVNAPPAEGVEVDGDKTKELRLTGAVTVNTAAGELTPASPLVTVTDLTPTVADAEMVTLTVSEVELTHVGGELTVMPDPEKVTARGPPTLNPVPVIVT